MRIIELTNEFSMGNGISEVIKTISNGLSDYYPIEIWYNYSLRELPPTSASLIKKRYPQILGDLLRIKERTVIHTHFGRTFLIGTIAKLLNPHLIHIHTEYINTPIIASKGKRSAYYFIEFLHRLSYLFGMGVDRAIGISKYACNEISRYGVNNKKISLIYLGIDSKNNPSFKIRSSPRFGSLARFSKSKNLKFLLESYSAFPDKSKLYLAGAIDSLDKQYYLECEKLAKINRVKLIANLPREKWGEFYSSFEVFLYPSQWEGFGLPILEAMSFGKPVICFNKYAMPEIVQSGYNGFAVNTEKEFFEKMDFFSKNPSKRISMGKNAIKTSKEFSKDKMSQEYLKTIANLVNHEIKK